MSQIRSDMNKVHLWLCRSALWKKTLEKRLVPWALEQADLGDVILERKYSPD